jgi:serine/threonine protein kinase
LGVVEDLAVETLEGTTLAGRYRLEKQLGAGAMGAVYLGVHCDLGKRVAVKIINARLASTPDATIRFQREARAASVIESNHIVQVFDAGRDPTVGLYIVSEYLVGEDLEERLAREGRLDIVTAVSIAVQVARGLSKAHAAGVVHRDLKPANIFLTARDDGSLLAKILDFGISKIESGAGGDLDAAEEQGITAAGIALGTPLYMSPEQAEGLKVDGRSDVWALCAVLYETLSGRTHVPDSGKHVEVLMAIVRGEVTPLRLAAPWVPPLLAATIEAGLVVDADRRIPDAKTLAQRLIQCVPEAALGMTGAFPAVSSGQLTPPPSSASLHVAPRGERAGDPGSAREQAASRERDTISAPTPEPFAVELESSGVLPVAEDEGAEEEALEAFVRLPDGSFAARRTRHRD